MKREEIFYEPPMIEVIEVECLFLKMVDSFLDDF